MPFTLRRKPSKHDVGKGNESTRPKSRFFDTEESVNDDLAPQLKSTKDKTKKSSRSTFYDDIPQDYRFIPPQVNSDAALPTKQINDLDITDPNNLRHDIGRPREEASTVWCRRASNLSRSFYDSVHDSDLLPYLIQFMTSLGRTHLIKFWLEATNFASATLTRYKTQTSPSIDSFKSPQKLDRVANTNPAQPARRDSAYDDIKQDAVNIYSQYIALDSGLPIGITDQLRNSSISKICSEDGRVDPLCFRECQLFVEAILENEYYKDFLESSYYCKYQIDVLTSGKLHLIDILYNENIIGYFREYVEQENVSALLEFWMAVDNFQTQLESQKNSNSSAVSLPEVQSDAMIIYEKYFSLQASNPLGFPDKVRLHVELNICREGGPLPDCFVIPKCIILETINKTLFPGFMQSQIYFRFLTELIHSASPSQRQLTPRPRHRRAGSGSSETSSVNNSEASGAALNTVGGTLSASSSISDIRGTDEDLKRIQNTGRKMSGMSLGLLDAFGHFTSELEIESLVDLDRKKASRNTKKKKAEEEMAWQIAKMIISDIGKQVSSNPSAPPQVPTEPLRLPITPKLSLSPTPSLRSSPNVSFRGSKKKNEQKLSQIEQLTEDFALEEGNS